MQSIDADLEKLDKSLANHGFERLERLGTGPSARVYRCRSIDTTNDLALKVWDVRRAAEPVASAFERYLARLDRCELGRKKVSRASLPIMAKSRKRGFLITELMRTSLAAMLRDPADPALVRQVLESALRGMIAAQRSKNSTMHGEIKPTNLFVNEAGEVVVGDSRLIPLLANGSIENRADLFIPNPNIRQWASLEAGERPPYPLGKYVAPELLNRKFGPVGIWVDQYRLGMSICEFAMGDRFESLFSGVGPEVIDSGLGWLRWQGSDCEMPSPRQTMPHLDRPVQEVLHRLTRKTVTDRYKALDQALQLLEAGSGETTRVPSDTGGGSIDILDGPGFPGPLKGPINHPQPDPTGIGNRVSIPPGIPEWDELPPEPWGYDWFKLRMKGYLSGQRLTIAGLALVASALILAGVRERTSYRPVRILVDPPNASVYVDGMLVAGESPHELNLSVGHHSFRAVHRDFKDDGPEIHKITRPANGQGKRGPEAGNATPVQEIKIAMQRHEAAIQFDIIGFDQAKVTAAVEVTLKDHPNGESTSIESDNVLRLPAGSKFEYRISLPGYEPVVGEKRADRSVDGKPQRIVSKPNPKPRSVVFVPSHADAQVLDEDGTNLGTCDGPIELMPRAKPYRLTIVKESFSDSKPPLFKLEPSDQPMTVSVGKLRPLDDGGVLEIETEPENLEFTLIRADSAHGPIFAGRGPKWRSDTMPNGSKWRIEAKLDRFRQVDGVVEIKTGTNARRIEMKLPESFELANGMKFRLIPHRRMVIEAGRRPVLEPKDESDHVIRVEHAFGRFDVFRFVSRGPFFPPALVRYRPDGPKVRRFGPTGARKVHLDWGIYVCSTETTLKWYEELMGQRPKLLMHHNDQWPVADISFRRAVEFLRVMERKFEFAPGTLRFLTSAEQEYLANQLSPNKENANLLPQSAKEPNAVGMLQPDEFGLYDIVGNVAEFTWPESGTDGPDEFVDCLGGHFAISSAAYYPALNERLKPWSNSKQVGFRVVYDPKLARQPMELTDRSR